MLEPGAKVFEENDPINTENLNGRALEANDCYTKAVIVPAPGSTDPGMGPPPFFMAGQLVLGRGEQLHQQGPGTHSCGKVTGTRRQVPEVRCQVSSARWPGNGSILGGGGRGGPTQVGRTANPPRRGGCAVPEGDQEVLATPEGDQEVLAVHKGDGHKGTWAHGHKGDGCDYDLHSGP